MNLEANERIKNQRIESQHVEVGIDGARALIQCELRNCHVVIDRIDHIVPLFESKFYGCLVDFKRPLKNSPVFTNDFYNCAFKGKFRGVDFGRSPWPDPLTKRIDVQGELVDCDFLQATLDMCRLFSADIQRQKFAPWPQFVIPFDRELEASKLEREWPAEFARHLDLIKDENPALSASTGTLADFKKRYGVTEADLMQALDDIGGVVR